LHRSVPVSLICTDCESKRTVKSKSELIYWSYNTIIVLHFSWQLLQAS